MDALRWRRRRAIANPAHARVKKAIERGKLPRLDGSILCKDCGVPAQVYDHREYAKPLQVDPVCRRCNRRRGPAIDAYAPFFDPTSRRHLSPSTKANIGPETSL